MNRFLTIFRVLRPFNLFMIALTQFLVRYCIILPAFITEYNNTGEFPPHLSRIEFLILVFATVLIAAGGYVINDVMDIHIDAVNKPGKNPFGKAIPAQTGYRVALLLFITGSIAGIVVGLYAGVAGMSLLLPFSAVSLYLYAAQFKKRLLIGNLVVALLSGLSVLIVALFEPRFYPNIQFVLIYALFAFFISMIRELIKDAEDVDGDERAQCKTFPVLYGLARTRILAGILIVLNLAMIIYFLSLYFLANTIINFWYLVGIFAVPFAALAYLVLAAASKKDFHYASLFAKIVMLYGILTMIPFYWYFLK